MDFLTVRTKRTKEGKIVVYPDFVVGKSNDLMIRGGGFYAVWNNLTGLWSIDEYDVRYLIDVELNKKAEELKESGEREVVVEYVSQFSNGGWSKFRLFISKLSDQFQQLDKSVCFSNQEVLKKDYVTRKLPYPLEAGDTKAFDSLFNTLYDSENLTKIMWAIGSVVAGDSKHIQKFFVLFGAPGTGKSTALNLIQSLFVDYYCAFDAQSLTKSYNQFSTEVFRDNPLIAINHEGDLSNIRDNSMLNSIVSHDNIFMNVKHKSGYTMRLNTMLFVATNKPVVITDAKSGLMRRLIDVHPSGRLVTVSEYDTLVAMLDFELGAIAYRCLEVYKTLGKNYYSRYKPVDMALRTNVVYNFVDDNFLDFVRDDGVTLSRAWTLYKEYCESSAIEYKMPLYKFRDEMKPYWKDFSDRKKIGDTWVRSVYSGFNSSMFQSETKERVVPPIVSTRWIQLDSTESFLDKHYSNQPAKYNRVAKWDSVKTLLGNLDTKRLHYVLPMPNEIVVDFDIRDSMGNKSLELNLEAASKFPPTYAETSKSGSGLHLHYYYDGDVSKLSRIYDIGIEVLVPVGLFAIRRKLSKCNDMEITTINSGLPLKETNVMVSVSAIKSERGIRNLIARNLNKEIHQGTKPSVDFIHKILVDTKESGLSYDVSDMFDAVLLFASNSTNHSAECMKIILNTPFVSGTDEPEEMALEENGNNEIVFFDIEVFPNLVQIRFKLPGDNPIIGFDNPTPSDIEPLMLKRLIGFNNRGYDNHILYAVYLGMNNAQVYDISKRIIEGDRSAYFREAYNTSYADVYDYAIKRQSLKKWALELGLPHVELNHPFNKPLPKEYWKESGDYCANDVFITEAVFDHTNSDFAARSILSELTALSVNTTTRVHAAKIMFGEEKNPQKHFVYTDLSVMFPGYKFERGVSTYRGEVVGEGGYVYSEPGMYKNVAYMDVASMHPTSAIKLNYFGKYTKNLEGLLQARLHIKHNDLEGAKPLYDGRLARYLTDESLTKKLDKAVKLIINKIYGYTCAKFDNPFKDPRNIDNIIAKRGALFMIDLKHALQERGVKVVHIKTDSVKIADYKEEDILFVKDFGLKYGYTFELEDVWTKMALVNDAVLIAQRTNGEWVAVGAQFAQPYVYKTLFSKEPIELTDLKLTKSVKKSSMYINWGEPPNTDQLEFIGRVGAFYPVIKGGGYLISIPDNNEDPKDSLEPNDTGDVVVQNAVSGTKGYKFKTAFVVESELVDVDKYIDISYYRKMVDDAIVTISAFGDVEEFLE